MPSKKNSEPDLVAVALSDWRKLLRVLSKLSLPQLELALKLEQEGKKRKQFLRRIAMRINKLRGKELLDRALNQY